MRRSSFGPFLLVLLLVAACGGESAPPSGSPPGTTPPGDLTPWQLEHGIGPITEAIVLTAIDRREAAEGKKIFDLKCASCHKSDVRYVGPPLGGVVGHRTPEYVMNMMLDPATMVRRHPEAKKLFTTFLLEMPNLSLTPEQAREILEYLRTLPPPPAPPAQ